MRSHSFISASSGSCVEKGGGSLNLEDSGERGQSWAEAAGIRGISHMSMLYPPHAHCPDKQPNDKSKTLSLQMWSLL